MKKFCLVSITVMTMALLMGNVSAATLVIDDFSNGNAALNNLGQSVGQWGGIVSESGGVGQFETTATWGGYFNNLADTGVYDLSAYSSLSFDAKANAAVTPNVFLATSGGDSTKIPVSLTTTMQTFTIPLSSFGKPLNTIKAVEFADFNVLGTMNIDNIQANAAPVPEPASLLLLGSGLVGLLGLGRKKKS